MPSSPRQGNRRPDVRVRGRLERCWRLRRGVAKPQVKLLIGVSDPYRDDYSNSVKQLKELLAALSPSGHS
jgi:hypothetical protein